MLRCLVVLMALFGFHSLQAQQFLSRYFTISSIADLDGKIVFAADDGTRGSELWITNGTAEGTTLLSDIQPGSLGSAPANFTVFNGKLYFTATTLQYGAELWSTNGTTAGTTLVKDIRPGHNLGAEPRLLTVYKNNLYFVASPDGFNTSLYRSNGTSAGTIEVADLGFGQVSEMVATSDYLYFVFEGALWRSDGTSPGTQALDIDGQPFAANLLSVNNSLYFSTTSSSGSTVRIYRIQGTGTHTSLKQFIALSPGFNEVSNLTAVGSKVFFSVRRNFDDQADELWVTDGTPGGTTLVKAFGWWPSDATTAMHNFVAYDNRLFFQAGSSANYALWASDGTSAGTIEIHTVELGYPYRDENKPVVAGGKLYFSGDGEFWISDGTQTGTRQLFDINQGHQLSIPGLLTVSGDKVYFAADDGYGLSLWSSAPAGEIDVRLDGLALRSGDPLVFDAVQVDGCAVRTIEISNAGTRDLMLIEAGISGQDFFLLGQLPEHLAPGEKITVDVYFLPLSAGTRRGRLTIRTTDANESDFVLDVRGPSVEGIAPAFCDVFDADALSRHLTPQDFSELKITNNSVREHLPPGTTVGRISPLDDPGIFIYELVPGVGDADNELFQIAGDQLRTAATFDYNTRNVYTVRVSARGDTGDFESFLTIYIARDNTQSQDDCGAQIHRLSFGINDIAYNSQGNLFAVCEDGVIMRSTNDGSSWTRVYSGTDVALYKIAFRGNSGFILGGGSLLKSDDNGATWFRLFLPDDTYVGASFFVNANTGFVADIYGALLRTDDGGRTWRTIAHPFDVAPTAMWFWDANTGIMCNYWGQVMKTTDGGVNWDEVDTGLLGPPVEFRDIGFFDATHGILVSATNVFKSDDGGDSWYLVSGVLGDYFTGLEFAGANTAYVYGGYNNSEVLITTNKGLDWTPVTSDPLTRVTGVAFKSSSNLVAITGNNSSNPLAIEPGNAILTAPAGTASWQVKADLRAQDFHTISFPTTSVGYVFGEFYGYKSTDGGNSWKQLNLNTVVTGAWFTNDQTGYIADGYNIYKTTNGGNSFAPVYSVDINGTANLRKLVAASSTTLIAYSSFGVLYRTSNSGTSWSVVYDEPLNQLMEVTFATASVGYAVDLLGKVLKTTNGGATWAPVYTWSGSGEFFNTIDFVSATTGFMGGKDGLLLKTTNGGVSWTPVFGGLPSTIRRLKFTSATKGYAFLEEGSVYETNDGGTSWSWIGNLRYIGISDASVIDDKLYYCGLYGNLGKIDVNPGTPKPGYISGPENVCAGDKVTFEVAGEADVAYSWSVAGASVSYNGTVADVTFPSPGDYVVTVSMTGACGAGSSRTLNVKAGSAPQPVIQGSVLVEANAEATYSIANPKQASRYSWNVTGATSFDQQGESVVVTWGKESGIVSVMETDNTFGCRATDALTVEVDQTTIVGVDDDILRSGIRLYPNPTPNYLEIESSINDEVTVHIYDLAGKGYGHQVVRPHSNSRIDLTFLPRGIYIVKLAAKGKGESALRVVKQ
jgi:ELWxxDGT repeat protein